MAAKRISKKATYRGVKMRRRGRSWQVDYGTRKEKRTQRSFKTQELARIDIDEHKKRKSLERAELKSNAVTLYHLTQRQRADVLEAIGILKGTASLRDATSFFIQQHGTPSDSCTVNELFEDYRCAKQRINCREWHLRTINYRIGKFAETFGEARVSEIMPDQIEKWIDKYKSNRKRPLSPVSRNNFLAYLNAFFNFAVKKGHTTSNPIEQIDRVRLDRPEIAILTPDEVRRLLFAARDHVPELVPYLTIAVFAGVRPAELQRLTWEHVNFDLKYIHITGGRAKVRGERYVDMEDVLLAWLKPYGQKSGQICPQDTYTFTKLFDRARGKAGLKESWKPDVLRHTYASYHVAKYERKDKTAMMMGNSVKMLDRHYRKPVHRSHTTKFWNMLPH